MVPFSSTVGAPIWSLSSPSLIRWFHGGTQSTNPGWYWSSGTPTAATTTLYAQQSYVTPALLSVSAYQNCQNQAMSTGLFIGSEPVAFEALAPHISRAEWVEREMARDQAAYAQAIAEHNEQEAARLQRLIEARVQNERRLREERDAMHREQVARRSRREQAETRAKELLLAHLTKEQRDMVEANGWFIVQGGRSKTRYRIEVGRVAGNIGMYDRQGHLFNPQQRITHRLCCHADSTIPTSDHILSQKLMLEHAEDDFLRIANRTRIA